MLAPSTAKRRESEGGFHGFRGAFFPVLLFARGVFDHGDAGCMGLAVERATPSEKSTPGNNMEGPGRG